MAGSEVNDTTGIAAGGMKSGGGFQGGGHALFLLNGKRCRKLTVDTLGAAARICVITSVPLFFFCTHPRRVNWGRFWWQRNNLRTWEKHDGLSLA